jgi:hypothetical protein
LVLERKYRGAGAWKGTNNEVYQGPMNACEASNALRHLFHHPNFIFWTPPLPHTLRSVAHKLFEELGSQSFAWLCTSLDNAKIWATFYGRFVLSGHTKAE